MAVLITDRPGSWRADADRPAMLRLLLAVTVAASLLWGAVAALTASQRASAARNVVAMSEPLSYDAEQIYQSLSDASATEAAAFLAGIEPPAARSRYLADIARAEAFLEAATAAGNQGSRSKLTVLSAGIPVYTGEVETARADNLQGLPVGAAFLGEASSLMNTELLPAAGQLYRQENVQLSAADAAATGLPFPAITAAVAAAGLLLWAQRRVRKHSRRSFNRGLLMSSAALLVSFGWLLAALIVARVQLLDARDQGSTPVQALAQADIAVLRAHADESLTLINRSGDDANQADFVALERQLGPGPGTLLTAAASAAGGSPGAQQATAAVAAAPAWFTTHARVRALDDNGEYDAAVQLAIGSGPASSGTLFRPVETGLTTAISVDESAFSTAARRGNNALSGLEAAMITAAVVMAGGCAWGLTRRLSEYR